ncbi:MAG: thioredoxin family protein [Akkermansia sp.]|nr:thioredoxin family protein [Akkermansia sp.]
MKQALRTSLLLICAPLLMLGSGCKDSAEEQAARAAQFTTATKPAPNPQRESLESLIRKDLNIPTGLPGAPKYELYSLYKGEDMRQVTEVSGRSLLLVFTAPWCKHSDAMRQALQTLAKEEKGNLQVIEINADEFPVIAEEFNLTKVPTTILYTEGVKLRTIEGAKSTEAMRNYIHNILTNSES